MNVKLQVRRKRQGAIGKMSCFLFSCLFLLTTQFAFAEDASKTILSQGEYQYQRAFYLYFTGDYLTSSIIANDLINGPFKEKDKVILLLKLSDIKRLHDRSDYPSFTFQSLPKDMSEIIACKIKIECPLILILSL